MTEGDTTILTKPNGDSKFFGVSVRAWVVMILVCCIAGTHFAVTVGVVIDAILSKNWDRVGTFANVGEPLYSLSIAAVAFYFGKANSNKPI